MLIETACAVKEAGAHLLRGGAFKPRSSPYSFQGLGEDGLEMLAEAREESGLPIITEVMSPEAVPLVGKYTDVFQIGARNMQNFPLLTAVGKTRIAGLPQAQHDGDRAGDADGGRVRAERRKPAGDGVRARHPHVRDGDPQHAGHQRHRADEAVDAPARSSAIRATARGSGN